MSKQMNNMKYIKLYASADVNNCEELIEAAWLAINLGYEVDQRICAQISGTVDRYNEGYVAMWLKGRQLMWASSEHNGTLQDLDEQAKKEGFHKVQSGVLLTALKREYDLFMAVRSEIEKAKSMTMVELSTWMYEEDDSYYTETWGKMNMRYPAHEHWYTTNVALTHFSTAVYPVVLQNGDLFCLFDDYYKYVWDRFNKEPNNIVHGITIDMDGNSKWESKRLYEFPGCVAVQKSDSSNVLIAYRELLKHKINPALLNAEDGRWLTGDQGLNPTELEMFNPKNDNGNAKK